MALGTLANRLVQLEQKVAQQHNTSLNPHACLDGLNPEWVAEEIAHCRADAVYFVDTYCKVESDKGAGVVPFKPFDYQIDMLEQWLEHDECIVLKARQLGITELASALALWTVNFHRDNKVIVVSQDEPKAKEFARKCRIAWEHLPVWLQTPLADPQKTTTLELANGSRVLPQAATERASRCPQLSAGTVAEETPASAARPALGRGVLPGAVTSATTSDRRTCARASSRSRWPAKGNDARAQMRCVQMQVQAIHRWGHSLGIAGRSCSVGAGSIIAHMPHRHKYGRIAVRMKDAMMRTPEKEQVVYLESPLHWPRVVERPALDPHERGIMDQAPAHLKLELAQVCRRARRVHRGLAGQGDAMSVQAGRAQSSTIAEIPAPQCVSASSPFLPAIRIVRRAFAARFHATVFWQRPRIRVHVVGVGFWDYKHGQSGVAPNAIELHPVLSMRWAGMVPLPPSSADTPGPTLAPGAGFSVRAYVSPNPVPYGAYPAL